MEQIIDAYRSMHEHHLIHRDLKTANIFLLKEGKLKLGDFEFAIDTGECLRERTYNVGSPFYMPLETLTSNLYSHKTDIWAIGVIFVELLTGTVPWKSKTEKELMVELTKYDLADIIPKGLSAKCHRFLELALQKEHGKRMNIKQLLSFSFQDEVEKSQEKALFSSNPLESLKQVKSHKNLHRANTIRPTTLASNTSVPKFKLKVEHKVAWERKAICREMEVEKMKQLKELPTASSEPEMAKEEKS